MEFKSNRVYLVSLVSRPNKNYYGLFNGDNWQIVDTCNKKVINANQDQIKEIKYIMPKPFKNEQH